MGLGVMGYADMLMKLRMKYGSKEAIGFTDILFSTMFCTAYEHNMNNAKKFGAFPGWKEVPVSAIECAHYDYYDMLLRQPRLANCSMLSIAPNGSLSTMVGCSGGAEPEFAISYERRTVALGNEEDKIYKVYCKTAKEYIDKFKTEKLPDYFVSSESIPWKDRIDTQAVIQEHIDTAISSTVNLPEETSVEDIEKLYLYAWDRKLKGITIFRSGCKRLAILTNSNSKKPETENKASEPEIKPTSKYDSIKPISRKTLGTTSGKTYCKKCACGTLYITVNTNDNGDIVETFVHTSKGGVCQANLNGLNRMISTSLRSGVMVSEIVDQLSSINCPACATLKGKGIKLDGMSCPDIIARTIKEFAANKNTEPASEKEESPTEKCPECGKPLHHEGGCVTCMNCGWSRCG